MIGARRGHGVEPFLAVEVSERARALEREGVDVVHLEFGEPDLEPPAVVREAVERALKDGRAHYTSILGILPLREAIVDHYRRRYGVKLSPDQILVTAGTSPAMMLLFGHLVDPGREVILTNPYYACYPNYVRYADGVPAYVNVDERDGFQYPPAAVQARIGPRTSAIMINSPANPTGAVLSATRLAAIADIGRRASVPIVSDEIYHGLTYEGDEHSILEYTDQAFVLNGFSKAFAMTGWRLGYLISPPEHVRSLQTLCGNFFISTSEFVQWAGVAALTEAGEVTAGFRAIFAERRRVMIDGLRAIGLGVGFEPTGAFYVLADARRFSNDSTRFAFEILDTAHVAITPGADFGANAEGYLRFSYASGVERIQEGLRRVGSFLARRR